MAKSKKEDKPKGKLKFQTTGFLCKNKYSPLQGKKQPTTITYMLKNISKNLFMS